MAAKKPLNVVALHCNASDNNNNNNSNSNYNYAISEAATKVN